MEENRNNTQQESTEQQISEVANELADNVKKKTDYINKRIDFDKKTYKKLEMMLPIYKEELEGNVGQSEAISYVIKKAVEKLFDEEFKKIVDTL